LNRMSSKVGVGDWVVDGGNNWGNLRNVVVDIWVVVSVVGIVGVVVTVVVGRGVEKVAGIGFSFSLTLDKGMSDNGTVTFDDVSIVNRMSSKVGVGDWFVDGGNNWGNTGNVAVVVGVVVSVVGVVVSRGVQKVAGISFGFSLTLDNSVFPQVLDGASLSGDAVVGTEGTGKNSLSGVSVWPSVSVGRSDEELGVGLGFGFTFVETASLDNGSGVGVSP
jgi:hypothetical protein